MHRRGRVFCCGRTRVSGVVSTVVARCVCGAVMRPEEVEMALVLRRDQHTCDTRGQGDSGVDERGCVA